MLCYAELSRWLALTYFELCLHSLGAAGSLALAALRAAGLLRGGVWLLVCPELVACALHAYFTLVVFVRCAVHEKHVKGPAVKVIAPAFFVLNAASFALLLAIKLDAAADGGEAADPTAASISPTSSVSDAVGLWPAAADGPRRRSSVADMNYSLVFVPLWLTAAVLFPQACHMLAA